MRRKDPMRAILIAGGAVFGLIAVMVLVGAAVVAAIAAKVPPLSQLHPIVQGGPSIVYYADGTQAGLIPSSVLRTPIAYSQMPTYLTQATVAIEDQRFYQTGAIDPLSIVRAALTDLTSGKALQGGSTITMQLVRNLYLSDDKTFSFKVKEAVIAERLEHAHSREWILKTYLNTVPYGTVEGQTADGVDAASWVFFDHPARYDDLAQSALLAGLPQAPTDYNPFLYPGAARARRNTVLAKMAQLGYISAGAAAAAELSPLGLRPNNHYQLGGSYLLNFIKHEVVAHYGAGVLASGGLRIYTTIDPHLSGLARGAITGVLNLPSDPSAAVVSENPANGYVTVMAQSGTYAQSEYNLATDAQRQPGSTFKAIVLADALSRGIDPFTTIYLSHTLPDGWLPSAPTYSVSIDGGANLDEELNLDQALVASDNTVFAQLAADLGEDTITKMAYAMGLQTHLDSYPAEALGGLTYGVTPLEMANVYSTIADGGYRNKQITIRKVVFPNGRVDASWGVPQRVQVLSHPAALVETQVLENNVQYGTATHSAIACPSAAKTGTTSGLVDAWLDGFTPNLTTVVWMGYAQSNISMTDVHGEPQQGGALPAQIWHDYMEQVVTPPCAQFAAPTSDPMSYLPFTGVYQQRGLASYVPPQGPTGGTSASAGGASAPGGSRARGGAQALGGGSSSPGGAAPPGGTGGAAAPGTGAT
jgi:penicillin-binding protein 1A